MLKTGDSDTSWGRPDPRDRIRPRVFPEIRVCTDDESLFRSKPYRMEIAQQPVEGRALGLGLHQKLPLDPPPVVKLLTNTHQDTLEHELSFDNPNLFCVAQLLVVEVAKKQNKNGGNNSTTRNPHLGPLSGTVTSSLHKVKSEDKSLDGHGFFVFGDLNVRDTGKYKIQFSLFEVRMDSSNGETFAERLDQIETNVFEVHNGRGRRAPTGTTDMTRGLNRAGVRLKMRKQAGKRKQARMTWSASLSEAMTPARKSHRAQDWSISQDNTQQKNKYGTDLIGSGRLTTSPISPEGQPHTAQSQKDAPPMAPFPNSYASYQDQANHVIPDPQSSIHHQQSYSLSGFPPPHMTMGDQFVPRAPVPGVYWSHIHVRHDHLPLYAQRSATFSPTPNSIAMGHRGSGDSGYGSQLESRIPAYGEAAQLPLPHYGQMALARLGTGYISQLGSETRTVDQGAPDRGVRDTMASHYPNFGASEQNSSWAFSFRYPPPEDYNNLPSG